MLQTVLLLPLCANLALFALFGHTLLPGRVALLTRLATLARGCVLDPSSRRYSRRVTFLWTLWFAFMAGLMLLGVLTPSWRDAALVAAGVNGPLCTAFLVAEFFCRRLVLPGYDHMTLAGFFRFLVRLDYRAALKAPMPGGEGRP
ncbi:MAG: hypothetical protein KDG89_05950 [Geminicoccaceae bacterium]|nr:hypothetical protein [Geminicoccaceae bacterium]